MTGVALVLLALVAAASLIQSSALVLMALRLARSWRRVGSLSGQMLPDVRRAHRHLSAAAHDLDSAAEYSRLAVERMQRATATARSAADEVVDTLSVGVRRAASASWVTAAALESGAIGLAAYRRARASR
jgi:hypothetical protein